MVFDLVYALNTDRLPKMLQFLQNTFCLQYTRLAEIQLKTPEANATGVLHWGFAVFSCYWLLLNVCQCCEILFTCPDLYDAVNVIYEDLAVADVACVERLLGSCDDFVNRDRGYDDFNLDLR